MNARNIKINRGTAIFAAVTATALALPAGASASYGSAINATGTAVTLTGDGASETLVVGDNGAQLTHNLAGTNGFERDTDFDNVAPGVQSLPADDSVSLTVNAGDGADEVTIATAALDAVTVDGQAGNDTITGNADDDDLRGGDNNDNLRGGGGNDVLLGGRNTDDVEGGTGNDVATWNNGDGNDTVDGDLGADEVVVNGAPTADDVFTIKPDPVTAGRVRFDRTNLGLFFVDFTSERLVVNGLGGGDAMTADAGLAPLTQLRLNGDQGQDKLLGGDGADLIQGGDADDFIAGGAGDDRLLGDRGTDAVEGGAGDDTLVWNNGDGSDTNDGDSGLDTVEINGSPGAGDVFTVKPNPDPASAGRVRFDRTNLVAFNVNLATSEVLAVNGLGGDDAFSAQPGTGLAIAVDGGSGADTLSGSEGSDTLVGGSGNDAISGGAGLDALDGQDGDDALTSRDGQVDLVRGGAGVDRAQTDQRNVDAVDSVENVDALPVEANRPPDAGPPPTVPPVTPGPVVPSGTASPATPVQVLTKRVTLKRRKGGFVAAIKVRAPKGSAAEGRLDLRTAGSVRLGGISARLILGSARYDLRAGETTTVRVKVPAGLARIARGGKIAALVRTLTGDARNAVERSARITLERS